MTQLHDYPVPIICALKVLEFGPLGSRQSEVKVTLTRPFQRLSMVKLTTSCKHLVNVTFTSPIGLLILLTPFPIALNY